MSLLYSLGSWMKYEILRTTDQAILKVDLTLFIFLKGGENKYFTFLRNNEVGMKTVIMTD